MANLLMLVLSAVSSAGFQQPENVTSVSHTAHVHSRDQGLCPFAVWSDRNGPIAMFGVYKSRSDTPQFGYLILFQPQPDRKEACKITRTLKKGTTSETSTDAVSVLKWDDNTVEVAWNLTTDDQNDRIDKNELTVNGKAIHAHARLLLAQRVDGNLVLTPVKATMPITVPDATSDDDWAKAIQAAISELKSSSPDVAAFLKST